MKQILLLFAWAFAMTAAAQTAEVDSINVDGLYSTEAADTIDCADLETPDIPQIPFEELDSITMSSLDDRYVVVYKDGKCGVYDLLKEENVTRIEYGCQRRRNNESTTCSMNDGRRKMDDAVYLYRKESDMGIFIVFDGMNGKCLGDLSSQTFIDIFTMVWQDHHALT